MVYTAVMVPLTDFVAGVLSALIIYFVGNQILKQVKARTNQQEEAQGLMDKLSLGTSCSALFIDKPVTVITERSESHSPTT